MKHAFLIIAYKHASLLTQLVKQLQHRNSFFFIHIDRKSDLSEEPDVKALKSNSNVYLSDKRINMHWAGFCHVRVTIQLLNAALRNPDIAYFHMLSGQCFPVRSMETLLGFFEANDRRNFIDHFPIADSRWNKSGGWDRLVYYHLYDVLNPRGRHFAMLNRKFTGFQRLLKFRRSYPASFPPPYGGATWWSLHRDFLEYFLQYIQASPDFYQRFEHTFCPDESIFQTVLMGSRYRDTAVNNNLRFTDWTKGGSSPPDLDEGYFEELMRGDYLFARKFAPAVSDKLVGMIKAEVCNARGNRTAAG